MREILFRGKAEINGKWIYGGVLQTNNWSDISVVNDYEGSLNEPPSCDVDSFEVIPETIGQYTGLTDKNGKKIFEGDIVGYYSDYRKEYDIGTVKYGNFNCSCCSGVYGWFFEGEDIREHSSYEVLGNIHDNPELLKGGAE